MNKVFMAAQVPFDLARRARVEAAKRNVSRSELVRQAVAAFLQEGEQQQSDAARLAKLERLWAVATSEYPNLMELEYEPSD